MDVRPSPDTSHPSPMRGEKFRHCVYWPSGNGKPGSPGKNTPGGVVSNWPLLVPEKRIMVEVDRTAVPINDRKVRLPTQTEIKGEFWIHLPGITCVDPNPQGTPGPGRTGAIRQCGNTSRQEIRHPQPGLLAIEGERQLVCAGIIIRPPHRRLRAVGHLVFPADHAEIVAAREDRAPSGSPERRKGEPAGNVVIRRVRRISERPDSDVGRPETGCGHCLGFEFSGGDSICAQAHRVDDVGSPEIRVTDSEGLGQAVDPFSGAQGVMVKRIRRRADVAVCQIPAEYRILR